jgi:Putative phage abortive infection protein
MSKSEQVDGDSKYLLHWLKYTPIVIGVLAILLIAIYAKIFADLPATESPGAWGSFGDYIGGLLNPVVAFCTLLVAISVWQQQTHELRVTQNALKDQATTAEKQRQEQRFFDLLNLYLRTLDSITLTPHVSGSPVYYRGKEAIKEWMKPDNRIGKKFREFLTHGIGFKYPNGQETVEINVASLQYEWRSQPQFRDFDHYFRVVYRILKESEKLLGAEHFNYVKLLRAQMTEHELRLIAMNLWFDEEGEKMRSLVEKYGLLKHLPRDKFHEAFTSQSGISSRVFGRSHVNKGGTIC